jgi:hypothetical protein
VLGPGDAVYLPRGTIHSAQALGEIAIHLTVGVHPITRAQLVRHLLDLAADDPQLRTSLPMGANLADPAVLAAELVETVTALHERLDQVPASAVAERVGRDLMQRTRPVPVGPLAQLAAADELEGTTVLQLRPALRARLETDDEGMRLVLLDRTISLPGTTGDAVKLVLSGAVFRPAELPGLELAEQLVLARRLVREGVAIPAAEPR